MQIIHLVLTENIQNPEKHWLKVNLEQYKRIEENRFAGGFLRYNISLYDTTTAKKSKWTAFNREQTDRQIDYFYNKIQLTN